MGQGDSVPCRIVTQASTGCQQGARATMEDTHIAVPLPKHQHILYAAVFDGHGGREAADYSQKKLHVNFDRQLPLPPQSNDVLKAPLGVKALTAAFIQTDTEFPAYVSNRGIKTDAGCTAAVIALDLANSRLISANVGDAQCVLSRGGLAIELSDLHKPWKFEEQRRIEAAGHYVVNGRLDGSLAVSRAIGDQRFKLPLARPTPRPLAAFTTLASLTTSTTGATSTSTAASSPSSSTSIGTTSTSEHAAPASPIPSSSASSVTSTAMATLGPPLLASGTTSPANHTPRRQADTKIDPHHAALSCVPHTRELDIQESLGDEFILIACDGLFDVMSCQEAVDWIRRRFKLRSIASSTTPPSSARGLPSSPIAQPSTTVAATPAPASSASSTAAATPAAVSSTSTPVIPIETKSHLPPPSAIRRPPVEVIDMTSITPSSWKSIADDLCKFAIQKGSKDNVSVMIIALEYRTLPTITNGTANNTSNNATPTLAATKVAAPAPSPTATSAAPSAATSAGAVPTPTTAFVTPSPSPSPVPSQSAVPSSSTPITMLAPLPPATAGTMTPLPTAAITPTTPPAAAAASPATASSSSPTSVPPPSLLSSSSSNISSSDPSVTSVSTMIPVTL